MNLKQLALFATITTSSLIYSQQKDSISSAYSLKTIEIKTGNKTKIESRFSQDISILSLSKFGETPFQTSADYLEKSGKLFVQKSQQGGGSPVIRGFEASRILLRLDGVRLNNLIYRSGHLQNLITVDAAFLENITIFNGSSSTLFGSDALGGTIDLRTKSTIFKKDSIATFTGKISSRFASVNNERMVNLDMRYSGKRWATLSVFSTNSYGDLRMGKSKNRTNPLFGLREKYIIHENGIDKEVTNHSKFDQKFSGFEQLNFLQKISYLSQSNYLHTMQFQYSNSSNIPRYDRLTDTNGGGSLKNAEWFYGPQKRILASYALSKTSIFKATDAVFQFAYQNTKESRHNRRFENYNLQNRTEKINALTLTADFTKRFSAISLFYGLESNYDNLNSTAFSNNIVTGEIKPLDTRYPNGINFTTKNEAYFGISSNSIQKINWNLGGRFGFASLKSTIADATFFPLPFDKIEQQNLTYSFSGGFVYNTNSDFAIITNISSGFRVPNVDDLSKIFESGNGTIIVPNENLKPEKTITTDFGIRTKSKKVTFENTIFYTKLFDAIVTLPFAYKENTILIYNDVESLVVANQNVGKAFVLGISSKFNWEITPKLNLDANFTYTKGRRIDEQKQLQPLDHIAPYFGRIGLQYKTKHLITSAYLLYNGKKSLKDYSNSGEDNLQYAPKNGSPSWTTYNLTNTFFILKNTALDFGVENILDINYRTFASGINAPGRNFYTALHYKF